MRPPVNGELAPVLTAYATDLTLIGTALRPLEGFNHSGNGTQFTSAVTSHTVWFHQPFRTDRWLLLRQHSPVLAHGRCFARGDVLNEDGNARRVLRPGSAAAFSRRAPADDAKTFAYRTKRAMGRTVFSSRKNDE